MAAEPETLHGAPVTRSQGQVVLHVDAGSYLELVQALHDEGFDMCVDLCAVDYLGNPGRSLPDGVTPERFEVVVMLLSMSKRERVRIRVQLPADDPTLPSLFPLFPGVDAMEREAYDLLGVRFSGHPDLTRILMPDDWEGHPLRKDYATGRIPVQFKAPQRGDRP